MEEYETFAGYSARQLFSIGASYRFNMAAINNPRLYQYHHSALPVASTIAVSAQPDGRLLLNFASRAVQGMIASEVPAIEALLDEAEYVKIKGKAISASPVFQDLAKETNVFLDFMRADGALDVQELVALGGDMVRDFRMGPIQA